LIIIGFGKQEHSIQAAGFLQKVCFAAK